MMYYQSSRLRPRPQGGSRGVCCSLDSKERPGLHVFCSSESRGLCTEDLGMKMEWEVLLLLLSHAV